MPKLNEWKEYKDDVPGMLDGDYRRGISNVRLCFTALHADEKQNEEVTVNLPSESIRIQQEQEIVLVDGAPHFTGKRRARVYAWTGMEQFSDFKQPPLPERVLAQNAGEAFLRDGPPVGAPKDDATGFHVAPMRYSSHGRETIDRIRDTVGDAYLDALRAGCSSADAAFVAYCAGTALKYRDRAGLKGPEDEDAKKAEWYEQMYAHVCGNGPDPRTYRQGFEPYARPETPVFQEQSLPFPGEEER